MAQRSIELGSFAPGINNRLEPTQLDKRAPDGSKSTYLYGADNVDVNEKGYLKRRKGTTTLVVGDTHSLWSDKKGAFVVNDGVLKRILQAGTTTMTMEEVYPGLPRVPLSYSRGADGDVYWSNGAVIRRITPAGDAPVATPMPNPQPSVAVSTGGSLPGGTYLLAFTALSANGESPATPVTRLDVPDGGAISVDCATPVEVYMSAPDGDVLTLQVGGATSCSIVTFVQNDRRCQTLNTAQIPPGRIVRHYRGRMLVAAGPMVYLGDIYNYGLYTPSNGYLQFPEDVTVIEPMDNGIYIVADKTYWISDLTEGDLQELLPHGAVFGTSARSLNDEEAYWQSTDGLIVGDKNSSVKAVQSPALQFGEASGGATLYRQQDGMSHVVSSRTSSPIPIAIASSYMEARVIQKGTDL